MEQDVLLIQSYQRTTDMFYDVTKTQTNIPSTLFRASPASVVEHSASSLSSSSCSASPFQSNDCSPLQSHTQPHHPHLQSQLQQQQQQHHHHSQAQSLVNASTLSNVSGTLNNSAIAENVEHRASSPCEHHLPAVTSVMNANHLNSQSSIVQQHPHPSSRHPHQHQHHHHHPSTVECTALYNSVTAAHQLRPLVNQQQQQAQPSPGRSIPHPMPAQSKQVHHRTPAATTTMMTTTTTTATTGTTAAMSGGVCLPASKSMSSLDQNAPFTQFPAQFRVRDNARSATNLFSGIGVNNNNNNNPSGTSANNNARKSGVNSCVSSTVISTISTPTNGSIAANAVRRLPKEMARFCTQQLNTNAQHLRSLLTVRQKSAALPDSQHSRQMAIVDLLTQYKGSNWRQEQLEYQMPSHDAEHLRRPTTEARFIRTRQRKSQVKTELFIAADSNQSCHKCNSTIPCNIASVKVTLNDRPRSKQPSTEIENIREHYYHVDCFTCAECSQILVDLRAHVHHFESPGTVAGCPAANDYRLFCGRHYVELFKPRCPHCDQLIFDDECTEAEGKAWHIGHFCCTECHRSLGGRQYIMAVPERHTSSEMPNKARPIQQQMPFCLTCFDILFGELCEECGELIGCEVGAIIHEGRSWHATEACFRCSLCLNSLLGKPFLPALDGRIYCSTVCSQAMIAHQKDRTRRQNKLQTLNSQKKAKEQEVKVHSMTVPVTTQSQPLADIIKDNDHSQCQLPEQHQHSRSTVIAASAEVKGQRQVESMTLDRYQLREQRTKHQQQMHYQDGHQNMGVIPAQESDDVKSLDLSYEQLINKSRQFFSTKYDWSKKQEFVDIIELPNDFGEDDDATQIVFIEPSDILHHQKKPTAQHHHHHQQQQQQQQQQQSKQHIEKSDSTDSGSVMERRESPAGNSNSSNLADSDGSFGPELTLNSDSSECNSISVDFRNFRQFRKTQESPSKLSSTRSVTPSIASPVQSTPCGTNSSQTFDIKLNLDSNQSSQTVNNSMPTPTSVSTSTATSSPRPPPLPTTMMPTAVTTAPTGSFYLLDKPVSLSSPASSNTSTAQWTISPPPEYSKLHEVDDISSVASSQAQECKQNVPKAGILKVKQLHHQNGIDSDGSSSSWIQVRPELHYQNSQNKQTDSVMMIKPRIIRTKSVSFDPKIDEQIEKKTAVKSVRRVGSKKSKSRRHYTAEQQQQQQQHHPVHHPHHQSIQQQQQQQHQQHANIDDDCSDCSESSCSTCSSSSDSDDTDDEFNDELWDLTKLEHNLDSNIGNARRIDSRTNNHDACIIS